MKQWVTPSSQVVTSRFIRSRAHTMQPPLQLHHTLENKLKLMTAEFWQSNFDEFSHALIREAAREYNLACMETRIQCCWTNYYYGKSPHTLCVITIPPNPHFHFDVAHSSVTLFWRSLYRSILPSYGSPKPMLRLILGQPPTIHMHAQMFQTWSKRCIRALSFCKWLKWRLLVLAAGDTVLRH